MKTDAELKKDVEVELDWDPAVNATALGVAVKDGVVSISGHLLTYPEKWAIQKALQRVAGVKAVALELDVRLSPDHRRSDTDIAQAAEATVEQLSSVPANAVRVMVDKGWVTLQGELEWDYQRRLVEKSVSHLRGVVGVSNDIALRHRPQPPDLAERIRKALVRRAEREARHIEIKTSGNGSVTLTGVVHSWAERSAAEGTVRSAAGVHWVTNQLKVE
ncbi:BON domain-containing protein [Azohydromonas lata]|uniref:BON domain-containing protein n=1 Tax=Azohydromonas lata TaxID=45677 RepID=A0ABU5ICF9_9BURK|nr:BON domain-containing protein [Azohydromonas lata]MDZ5456776.1 BON domain-containing protein [Azohydromonas lata]